LREEGFTPVKELTMVDWYFDRFTANGGKKEELELPLIRHDHWLRYRESSTLTANNDDDAGTTTCGGGTPTSQNGRWELKRGNKVGQSTGAGVAEAATTVYEEIEGIRAVEIAHSVLLGETDSPTQPQRPEDVDADDEKPQPLGTVAASRTTTSYEGYSVPVFPIELVGVAPFARIVTHRSKWKKQKNTNSFVDSAGDGLVVDLDTTPDGYAVGEVEAVVVVDTKEEEGEDLHGFLVTEARARIQKFLAKLLKEKGEDEDSSNSCCNRVPMGKLEQFLYRNQPQIYEACVESGVISKQPVETNRNG